MSAAAIIITAAACLFFCAFFTGAETALFFADRAVLRGRSRNGSMSAAQVEKFLDHPQRLLATSLVGAAMAVTLATVPATLYFMEKHGPNGAWRSLVILIPLFVVFGSAMPRLFFQPRANRFAPAMIPLLRLFYYIFLPVLGLLMGITRLLLLVAGGRRVEAAFWYTRDDLKHLLTDPASQSILDEEGRHMIDRIFEFSKTVVEEAMIPLVEVDGIDRRATVDEALRRISLKMFSRYPIYEGRIDNIVGMIYSFDLLELEDPGASIAGLVRTVHYVPYNKPIDELLFSMQRENYDFAVVVDEYGGCVGLITREDIIEEIVGEIEDEHDQPVVLYRRLDDRAVKLNARMEIYDANEILGWNLPEGEYETVGGFLLSLFKRVPRAGERIRFRDLVFIILEATPRSIVEVKVEGEVGIGNEGFCLRP